MNDEDCFGQWQATDDGLAHYYLPTSRLPLCRARRRLTGAPVRKADSGEAIMPHCGRCIELNTDRWASLAAVIPA